MDGNQGKNNMALTRQQSLSLYGTDAYTAWPEDAAAQDAKNKGIGQQSGSLYGTMNQAIDEYINSLISEAKGDKEFIIKKLTAEHQLALGNNDSQTAQFLETVSDALEKKVGRIPYDYEKYTARELEDYAKSKSRLESSSDLALKRLAEDEAYLKQGVDANALIDRRNQESTLNQRGIIQGTREQAQGLAGQEVKTLETDIDRRYQALAKSIGREKENIGISKTQGLEDLALSKNRSLEDLKTEARRSAENQQLSTSFGTESANRSFEARKKALEAQRQEMRIPTLSSSYNYIYG